MDMKIFEAKNKIIKVLYGDLEGLNYSRDDLVYSIIEKIVCDLDKSSRHAVFMLVLKDFREGFEGGLYPIDELERLYNNTDYPILMKNLGFYNEAAEWYQLVYDIIKMPHWLIWKGKCYFMLGEYRKAFNELLNCYAEVSWLYTEDGDHPYPELIEENKNLLLKIFDELILPKPNIIENESNKFLINSMDSVVRKMNDFEKTVNPKTRISLIPESEETNFLKLQQAIFDNVEEYTFVVDPHLRVDGLKNLFLHLRRLKEGQIRGLRLLVTKTAFEDYGKNFTTDYKEEIKRMSKELGISINVKCINDRNVEKSIHDRYVYTKGKCWKTPPFNKLHKFDSDVTGLEDYQIEEKSKLHEEWYKNALDLTEDFEKVVDLVDAHLKEKNK